ncbi:MAG TPA: methylated-DNA--[protein]-cysteine S-methyltransferase [Polyangiaceae bacterium]|nr:methylated-DNA--[protein]-cysteine S-methyltransferase [Polyangiaceae bacterium]
MTPRGLSALVLADDARTAEAEARARSAPAALGRPSELDARAADVVRGIDGAEVDVPIDALGTPFQKKVWRALTRIPAGGTTTYEAIARRIGAPRAIRAVGTACGANPIAVFVPCHRVLRKDGGLGGYRWGLERKEALLARESANVRRTSRARPSSG